MNIRVFAKIFRFSVTFSIQRHERSGGRSQCQAGSASATAGGGNTKKAKRWESSHVEPTDKIQTRLCDWWFGTFFIFLYIGNNHPN